MERLIFARFARFSDDHRTTRVVEPELDMQRREHQRPSALLERIRDAMRWLAPSPRLIAPPMRSIDRELWEASNDR
jgi:hypothetical protein